MISYSLRQTINGFTPYLGGGKVNYLNATEDETIEFGTPKVGIESYPNNYEEQWYLFAPKGGHVQIDFDTFELEKSENCKNDYVEVREAYYYLDDGEKKVGGQYGPILSGHKCGSTKPSSIQSKNNMVWVHFRSDSNTTTVYKGFKASFKAGAYYERRERRGQASWLVRWTWV